MKGSTALMMQKLQKCIFFKINVFRNAFQREAKKIEGCNQSEQDKIVFTELYNTFFRFNLSFSNAELHRFLWSLLAGYTLYLGHLKLFVVFHGKRDYCARSFILFHFLWINLVKMGQSITYDFKWITE